MFQPQREKDNRISSHDHIIKKNNSMAKDNRCILEPHGKITDTQDQNSILSTSIYEETPEISKYFLHSLILLYIISISFSSENLCSFAL